MIIGYVKGQDFTLRQPTIASGTIDYLSATFVFSNSDWNECDEIWVHFAQGDKVYDAEIINGKVGKDEHINLSDGEWEVYLHGNVNVNGEVVERITTEVRKLSVTKTGIIDGNPFPSVEASTSEKILAKANYAVEIAEGVREDFDNINTGGGLTPEQEAEIQANTAARHTHDNYWSLSDLHCEASEVEQGGNNPFPILPDYVGVDRPTFRSNYLRYDSDGAVINKVEKKEENGSKFFRMYFNKGILDTLFNVPPFVDIPVKEINEKTEIGLNGTGLELDLGVGTGGGNDDFSQFIEEVATGTNLYPPTTEGWTNSASLNSSGAITTNTKDNMFITPHISVEPNTQYAISNVFGWDEVSVTDYVKGRAYTADGTALAVMAFAKNTDGSYGLTTPEGASYIMLGGYKVGLSSNTKAPIETIIELFNAQFMLVKGTELPTTFEPFGDTAYKLKDVLLPSKSVNIENVADEAITVFAPLAGKTIVNFGDSIFGNQQPPNDISTFLAEKTGATVYNCGFGGCRMTPHETSWYDAFCMYNLADAITTRDFTKQDEAVASGNLSERYGKGLERLKGIDFSNTDIITIAYGTNDYKGYGASLDNADNPLDVTTFGGALRYSIEKLLTAYPNLKIFVLSIAYRFFTNDNNEYVDDSNNHANNYGKYIKDYNAKLKEVACEYNLPYVDDYNIGIGKFNRLQYFNATDGTHHNENGRRFIAEHLATALSIGGSVCDCGTDKVVIAESSAKINANTKYDFCEATELTITFAKADTTKLNEYMFSFTSGATPTVLTLPDTVKWANELTIEANKRYEVSIVDNIGLWCAVDYEVSE